VSAETGGNKSMAENMTIANRTAFELLLHMTLENKSVRFGNFHSWLLKISDWLSREPIETVQKSASWMK
jgi:hypothetical protein